MTGLRCSRQAGRKADSHEEIEGERSRGWERKARRAEGKVYVLSLVVKASQGMNG